jgi:hypothetical protein
VYAILSSIDQGPLIDRVRAGEYPSLQCEKCRELFTVDIPMLIHRSSQGSLSALIYSPPWSGGPDMAQDMASILVANLGLKDRDVTLRVIRVPRVILPEVLARDVRVDCATPSDLLNVPPEIAAAYREMIDHLRTL